MKKTLKAFLCERNRATEEIFAQVFSEKEDIRLDLNTGNSSFTDGKWIMISPALGEAFADEDVLRRAEDYMEIGRSMSEDPWLALHAMTRGLNIHECLHLLYSEFPNGSATDARATTKFREHVLAMISNIIEDAYIEAVGCSVYDNLEYYLSFLRLAVCYAGEKAEAAEAANAAEAVEAADADAEAAEATEATDADATKAAPLVTVNTTAAGNAPGAAVPPETAGLAELAEAAKDLVEYLTCMARFLLYPMGEYAEPSEAIAGYVEQTKQLFMDGSLCGNPKERYGYTQRIFDIIEPIVPKGDYGYGKGHSIGLAIGGNEPDGTKPDDIKPDDMDLSDIDLSDIDFGDIGFDSLGDIGIELELESIFKELLRILPGSPTQRAGGTDMGSFRSEGKVGRVTGRLFTDLAGKISKRDFGAQERDVINTSEVLKSAAQKRDAQKTDTAQPVTVILKGSHYDCADIHKDIAVEQTKLKPDNDLQSEYKKICAEYQSTISSFSSRFSQLLIGRARGREEKRLIGSGISSRRLADPKKRYWHRNTVDNGIPDIAIMLLVDGSGSMKGQRSHSAMVSCVILHEVLKRQGITHAIVEHRAVHGEPLVQHNILVDFSARDSEKLNILSLRGDDNTREGLSLYWAEKYLAQKTTNDDRLIIAISDGCPEHYTNDCSYGPPVSTEDAAAAARKIINRGTDIVAIALDNGFDTYSCYDELRKIYPSVVHCTDLKRLTGQLLGVITKVLG
jgi:hypothetical protein